MNKNLEQLVELSEYDKSIDKFIPQIEDIEKEFNSKKNEINLVEEQIATVLEEIEDVKSQISSTNTHIAEFSAKLKDAGKKSASVKTEREAKALQLEESLAKDQLSAANEDIVKLEKSIDFKEGILKELNEKKVVLEAELESTKEKTEAKRAEIEKLRDEVCANKDKLVKKMDHKLISFYEKIRKWAGNTAVVKVKKQACYGCFMRINDKTFISVIKGDDIITCPHCGRILYKEIDSE
ncbi:zinc ribbon domain-containing protein (DUF164 domain) [Campylobacter blaseri]|uniref:C4-type zinc ribbon domain-containing protein n=1 Tax=Campylobacter blaseri TaxID=2042961 RepID=A0A2P8R088_9BACT|nr:zinc ribbon domain-containing protein [Campylobacter blaseri]PSM51908.1 hypothetical protein CQ405_04910 [Campylobacter blaseri]PSM53692.1 hypothetical protein CRN67_04910 [Campylobacter blaseri]QKF85754.1 zinc ribbon domain-containing protein (DUF164 domain) [Campylobacter blaseri]